jgi:hypothetical protein
MDIKNFLKFAVLQTSSLVQIQANSMTFEFLVTSTDKNPNIAEVKDTLKNFGINYVTTDIQFDTSFYIEIPTSEKITIDSVEPENIKFAFWLFNNTDKIEDLLDHCEIYFGVGQIEFKYQISRELIMGDEEENVEIFKEAWKFIRDMYVDFPQLYDDSIIEVSI